MGNLQTLTIFKACTENVRELERAKNQLKRSINLSLRRNDQSSVRTQSFVLALVYSAWSEASFSKLIHTPYGFDVSQIEQIRDTEPLHSRWNKCVDLGITRVPQGTKSNDIPNRVQFLKRTIEKYIIQPSLLRNKIAHGQWKTAINSDGTNVNPDLSATLSTLDVVEIERWFSVHSYLYKIIEDMIISPNLTFHRDYWKHFTELEKFLSETSNWTSDTKRARLLRKPLPSNLPKV